MGVILFPSRHLACVLFMLGRKKSLVLVDFLLLLVALPMCDIHNQLDIRRFRVDMFGLNCCGLVAFILYIHGSILYGLCLIVWTKFRGLCV